VALSQRAPVCWSLDGQLFDLQRSTRSHPSGSWQNWWCVRCESATTTVPVDTPSGRPVQSAGQLNQALGPWSGRDGDNTAVRNWDGASTLTPAVRLQKRANWITGANSGAQIYVLGWAARPAGNR